ncbi:hypothetical protein WJ62_25800 [Burkholderia diffusa]|nr:hypothetical protein WJ62_25800 [Burkholderia diffusa]
MFHMMPAALMTLPVMPPLGVPHVMHMYSNCYLDQIQRYWIDNVSRHCEIWIFENLLLFMRERRSQEFRAYIREVPFTWGT